MEGWICLYRKILDNPIICKDSDYFTVWCYLLLSATHKTKRALFKGKEIILQPGQLITGRKNIAKKFKIDESKVQRILKTLENEQQIAQQTSSQNRLIAIKKWELYQKDEQQNKQQVNNECTTSEHKQQCNNNINNNIYMYTIERLRKDLLDICNEYDIPTTINLNKRKED